MWCAKGAAPEDARRASADTVKAHLAYVAHVAGLTGAQELTSRVMLRARKSEHEMRD